MPTHETPLTTLRGCSALHIEQTETGYIFHLNGHPLMGLTAYKIEGRYPSETKFTAEIDVLLTGTFDRLDNEPLSGVPSRLHEATTDELVNELAAREGVIRTTSGAYQNLDIKTKYERAGTQEINCDCVLLVRPEFRHHR